MFKALGSVIPEHLQVWHLLLWYIKNMAQTLKEPFLICCLASNCIKGEVLSLACQHLQALRAALLDTLVPTCIMQQSCIKVLRTLSSGIGTAVYT